MRAWLLCLLAATSLSAADLKIDPIAPDDRDSIRFTAIASGCGTIAPEARVEGSKIIVDAHFIAAAATPCFTPPDYVFTTSLAPLPAGLYEIETRGTRNPVRRPFIVRPSEVALAPNAVPISGGPIRITTDSRLFSLLPSSVVSIDGVRAKFDQFGGITAPPHAPGTVDIAITTNGVTTMLRSALTYFDSAAPPDPQIFEPLLFPVAYSGPGAFGTQWETYNTYLGGAVLRDSLCPCPTDSVGFSVYAKSPAGVMLFGVRGSGRLTGDSVMRETTRTSNGLFQPLPVVHESDFKDTWGPFAVPAASSKYRVTLRVWTLDRPLTMTVHFSNTFIFQNTFEIRTSDAEPHYVLVDLTERLKRAPTSTVFIGANVGPLDRAWAMVAITNNETQEVTILTTP